MADELVILNITDGVATLSLNDPQTRNAMSDAMGQQFTNAVAEIIADKSVRVVVLRGAGKAFSAGGHLDMLHAKTKLTPEQNRETMLKFYHYFLSILDVEVPVIAALNGHAVGAGLCVALACDIRVCHEKAKLGLNFLKLALHPGMAVTYFLPRVVSSGVCADLLYTGRIVEAKEGRTLGLVDRVVADADFDSAVADLAAQIVSSGPMAARNLKKNLKQSLTSDLSQCLEREANAQAEDYAGEEFLEGITAAKEKRKAKF